MSYTSIMVDENDCLVLDPEVDEIVILRVNQVQYRHSLENDLSSCPLQKGDILEVTVKGQEHRYELYEEPTDDFFAFKAEQI